MCSWARSFILCLMLVQSSKTGKHHWKIVDWDVMHERKQTKLSYYYVCYIYSMHWRTLLSWKQTQWSDCSYKWDSRLVFFIISSSFHYHFFIISLSFLYYFIIISFIISLSFLYHFLIISLLFHYHFFIISLSFLYYLSFFIVSLSFLYHFIIISLSFHYHFFIISLSFLYHLFIISLSFLNHFLIISLSFQSQMMKVQPMLMQPKHGEKTEKSLKKLPKNLFEKP